MKIEKRCYKFRILNGPIIDITPNVIEQACIYLQKNIHDCEAGGYLVGFENSKTSNITINGISLPNEDDERSRMFCKLKSVVHKLFLSHQKNQHNYYMGNWHTHPQAYPLPSSIDYNDWTETLKLDKTGSNYAFFIIFGTEEFKVWYADYTTNEIKELEELNRVDDYYNKE